MVQPGHGRRGDGKPYVRRWFDIDEKPFPAWKKSTASGRGDRGQPADAGI